MGSGLLACVQVDAYLAYRVLADKSGVTLAFCWSHIRRCFYEIAAACSAPIASEALRTIAELYRIEEEARGRPAHERRAEPWLRGKLGLISQKTKLAEAIRYALSRWMG